MSKTVKHNQGVIYMLTASFCFALVGACTRILRHDISTVELVFFRNVIGVIFVLASLYHRPIKQEGGKPFLLAFRGIIGTLALYFFFYGITKIGLAEAITYQQSYPVFLSLFAFFAFNERLRKTEWAAILLGFVGILLIFVPQMTANGLSIKHHSIGVLNAVFTGLAYLSIRGLAKYYETRSIVLSFMVAGIVLPIISMFFAHQYELSQFDFLFGQYIQPMGNQWYWILLLGFSALIGQIFLTKAFSYEKTGVIAAVGYSNIVFSVLFGVLLGDPMPSFISFVGIGFIITCGLIISRRKK